MDKEQELYIEKLEEMLSADKFRYADQFLQSVYDQTQEGRELTENQMSAIDNIYDK